MQKRLRINFLKIKISNFKFCNNKICKTLSLALSPPWLSLVAFSYSSLVHLATLQLFAMIPGCVMVVNFDFSSRGFKCFNYKKFFVFFL